MTSDDERDWRVRSSSRDVCGTNTRRIIRIVLFEREASDVTCVIWNRVKYRVKLTIAR